MEDVPRRKAEVGDDHQRQADAEEHEPEHQPAKPGPELRATGDREHWEEASGESRVASRESRAGRADLCHRRLATVDCGLLTLGC